MGSSEPDTLYLDGRHYDRMFPSTETVQAFFVERGRRARGAVLELASGTGPICLALSRAGIDVTGLELSRGMLDVAREKAAAESATANFVHGDMRDFALGRRFGLIFITANAICHLYDREALEACLRCVRSHMEPGGGRFIVSVFPPHPDKLEPVCDVPQPFSEYDDPSTGRHVVVTHTYTYDAVTQIKQVTTHHRTEGVEDETHATLRMRMYFPADLDAALEMNGLQILEKDGDFEGTPFGADSSLQVVTCGLR